MHVGFDESDQIDFKESWSDSAMRNLSSFANTRGGAVYVGVDKKGFAIGTDVSDAQQQRVANLVMGILGVVPDIRVERFGAADVLVVRVSRSSQPVLLRGTYNVRSGTVTTELRPEQWAANVLRQAGKHWDELASEVPASAADPARVRAFIRAARALPQPRIPPEITEGTSVESVLTSLQLIVEDRLTNAGVLLFMPEPQRVCSQARVRIARIRSTDDLTPLPDVTGTVLDQIENAIRLVNDYNPTRYGYEEPPPGKPALRRQEHPKYASFAIREALVNALVHRDYAAPGDVQVRVYDDRIEVWNPGELASGLTPESLKQQGHPSIRRNPSIALVTWMTGFFDTWGTGTLRMVEQSRSLDLPDPVFKPEAGGFRVILLADALSEDLLRERGLSGREIAGVLLAKQNGRITSADYQRVAEVGHSVAAEDLADLVGRGVFVRHGAGRVARH